MMNIKEIYESPEMEVVNFDSEDIITTSTDIETGSDEVRPMPW